MSGALGAILAGGDFGDVLRGAAIGAISGALTGAMHGVGSGTGFSASNMANVVGHGVIGGLTNVAMGGKFGDGFLASAASAATSVSGLTNPDSSSMNIYGRTAVAAIAGGTASAIGGGKFVNGAGTGAMHHLINAEGGKAIDKLSDQQVGILKDKFKDQFNSQLGELNQTPTGRKILAFLADNSDKWSFAVSTGRARVDGTTLVLTKESSFDTIAHEAQHLTEALTKNNDYYHKVDFEGDYNDLRDRGDYSSEFRAMRIQNQVRLEFYKNPRIDILYHNYSDPDNKVPIPTSILPK